MSKLERWSFASSSIYGGTEQIQEAAVAVRAVKGWINFLGSSLESQPPSPSRSSRSRHFHKSDYSLSCWLTDRSLIDGQGTACWSVNKPMLS
jgi:hypothetical protein